jgi:hypothetical protein
MSFKIHGGIRFQVEGFAELSQRINAFRHELLPLQEQVIAGWIARRAVHFLDGMLVSPESTAMDIRSFLAGPDGAPGPHDSLSPLGLAVREFRRKVQRIRREGVREPDVDTDFEIVVLPDGADALYGLVVTEQPAWQALLLSKPWVREHAYWDNTDRPSWVSAQEWSARRDLWTRLLNQGPHRYSPGLNGFVASCTSSSVGYDRSLIEAAIPSVEDRLRKQARNHVRDGRFRLIRQDRPFDMYRDMGFLLDAVEWVDSSEGQSVVQETLERLRSLLPKALTAEDLDREIPLAVPGAAPSPSP